MRQSCTLEALAGHIKRLGGPRLAREPEFDTCNLYSLRDECQCPIVRTSSLSSQPCLSLHAKVNGIHFDVTPINAEAPRGSPIDFTLFGCV